MADTLDNCLFELNMTLNILKNILQSMAYASPVFGSNFINDMGYTQDALSKRRLASVT